MLRLVLLWLMIELMTAACNSHTRRFAPEDENFGLDQDGKGDEIDDKSYFTDLEKSDAAVGFESSFPLSFMIGKSVDKYDDVPIQAKTPPASQLAVHLGECRFALKTTKIQADRYILAGQWIKLNEGLVASVPVRLEPNMDLNLKFVSKLVIEVPSSQLALCQKLLSGRRIYIGRFHLNQSKIGLLTSPGYPRAVFSSRSMEPKGKRVYVRWQVGAPAPTLIDDFDFPATVESGIFRALMGDKGYYYLVFQPALRMDQVDQLVIKIPLITAPDARPDGGPRGKRKKAAEPKENDVDK